MIRFTIPSDTFTRMAHIAAREDDNRPSLQCVRLEYRDGRYFAIASNSWAMAVQYLGETDQSDSAVNVKIDDLDNWSDIGDFVYDWYPEFNVLTELYNRPAAIVADADLPGMFIRWYDLFPRDLSHVDKGFLYFDSEYFWRLAQSSPSGQLCFPEVIDNTRAVIVRDAIDPNWCGMFLASDKRKTARAATRPEWML